MSSQTYYECTRVQQGEGRAAGVTYVSLKRADSGNGVENWHLELSGTDQDVLPQFEVGKRYILEISQE